MTDRVNSKLIRLQCDGELSAEEADQLRRCLEAYPEDREAFEDQVKFERRLRECVKSAMGSSSTVAPESLRQRIGAEAGAAGARWNDVSLFLSPRRANVFAIAATLAVIAGAILYGIFGRSIDDVRQTPVDLVAEAALFASREHESSAANDGRLSAREAKLVRQAEGDLTDWLGAPVRVFDLSELNYEFVGVGRCEMPWPERSGRLIYRSTKVGERQPRVSVFVARVGDKGRGACRKMNSFEWYAEGQGKCKHQVMCLTDRKLMYLVVCCNERDLQDVLQKVALAKNGPPQR